MQEKKIRYPTQTGKYASEDLQIFAIFHAGASGRTERN